MPTIPLIYFAFAHDFSNPLPNLEKEGQLLYELLLPRKQQRHVDLHRDEFLSIPVMARNLRTFKDQVVIFHYGGHAGSKALFLKDQKAHAAGIAELLSQQRHLKLVFLNGCSTQEQVDYLLELGVPAVIATACPINDGLATEFAEQVYDALVKDHTLKEAYDHAAAYLKSKDQPVACLRGIKLDRQVDAQTWILRVADEAQYGWKLPQEVHPDPGGKLPHILTDSPIPPEIFLGREDDLQRIHDKLFAPGGNLLLLVNGEGGVGKTSIASRYYHTYKDDYTHVAWVTSNRNLVDAVLTLDRPLGLWQDESYRQLDTPQKLEALLTALSNLPKPSLLVIDNANELDDLKAYYPQLQRCSNFHILFTTRISEYAAADFFKIEPLPEDIALQAFKTHYKAFEAAEEPLFRELYRTIGGNTLVLELFAKNLNHFNNRLKKRYLLADLKRDVEQGLLRLSQSAPVPTRYQGLRQATPEEIISAMYDISDLPKEETALLAAFAALPAERIAFETLDTLLNHDNLDTHLLHLAQKGWLDYSEEDAAFKCSPVVQEALRRQHGDWEADCGALVRGLVRELDSEKIHEENYRYSSIYARYAETVVKLLEAPDDDLATLCQNLGIFHTDTGDLGKALQAYDRMECIQAVLLENSPEDADFKNGLAISYEKLGQTHSALGNLDKALQFFEERSRLGKELYEAFPNNVGYKNGLAISYIKLGWFYETKSQNLDQSNAFYQKSKLLLEELVASFPDYVEFRKNLDWVKRKT